MTYSEYRRSFAKPDEFIRAFGSLSEEEAKELVSTIEGSNAIKACAITTWRMARKKLEGEKRKPSGYLPPNGWIASKTQMFNT